MYQVKSTTALNNTLYGYYFFALCTVSLAAGVVSTLYIFFDGQQGYKLLPFLPFSYLFSLLINKTRIVTETPNIGIFIYYSISLLRLVILPLLYIIYGYYEVIEYNSVSNTPKAILLMAYETIAIAISLNVSIRNTEKISVKLSQPYKATVYKRLSVITLALILVGVILNHITPEVLQSYTTIFDMIKTGKIPPEQNYLVRKYGVNFVKKLSLVSSNYLFKILKLLIPMCLVTVLQRKEGVLRKSLAILVCLLPFLYVSGSIAVSFHYLFLIASLFIVIQGKRPDVIFKPLIIAMITIMLYLVIRVSISSNENTGAMIRTINAYFSGVNIVSGSFNLEGGLPLRLHYFLCDIFGSIPFSGTLFGIDGMTINEYFCYSNECSGQIAPTIGLGCYYFSPILAPLYSVFFIKLSETFGKRFYSEENPHLRVIYVAISYYSALAVVAYNIEIVLGIFCQVILPIYIVFFLCYKNINAEKNNEIHLFETGCTEGRKNYAK